jgi:uncharacterized membrane protein YhaH (DUF805 family)
MRLLSLLFDPRGAIDRRAFWSGLLQLTLVSVMISFGLAHLGADGALTVLPVIGEAFAVADLAGHVHASGGPDIPMMMVILTVAARLYATACLCLKRLRDAGHGPVPLVVVGLSGLAVHGLAALWTYDLWDREMAVILPLFADVALTALPWTILLAWLGTARRRRAAVGAWA